MSEKGQSENTKLLREIKRTAEEIESVKKLLILYLIKMGVTSEEIGQAIGVDSSFIRKMFSIREVKKFKGA